MKNSKFVTRITSLAGASLCLIALLLVVGGQVEARGQRDDDEQQSTSLRGVRQTSSSSRVTANDGQQASVASMAEVSSVSGQASKPAKPASMKSSVAGEPMEDEPVVQPKQPGKKFRKPKRPNGGQNRRPPANDDEEDEPRGGRRSGGDEDCDNEDDDGRDSAYNMFETMAANPMRHFRRMMNNVFDQMPGSFGFPRGGDDDGEAYYRNGRGSGDSVASSAAAAFSSEDGGYSKLSSSVTNNGRTRGIVSETRNGRTKTRRIGGGDDGDDSEE